MPSYVVKICTWKKNTLYMRMKSMYIYIVIYKWICMHIIITLFTHNEYNKFIYIYIYIYTNSVCVCLIFFIWNAYFLLRKQIAVPIIIFCEWMTYWMPLKKPTRWVSEGCPLSTEWEVIERGFGGCARARVKIWRVSPGRVPPSKAIFALMMPGAPFESLYILIKTCSQWL